MNVNEHKHMAFYYNYVLNIFRFDCVCGILLRCKTNITSVDGGQRCIKDNK